jgi:hypothetical protein
VLLSAFWGLGFRFQQPPNSSDPNIFAQDRVDTTGACESAYENCRGGIDDATMSRGVAYYRERCIHIQAARTTCDVNRRKI